MPDEPAFNPKASVEVGAIYGIQYRRGLVVLRLADGDGNVLETFHTAPKAREIASMLIEAAGAADADEALVLVLEEAEFKLAEIGAFLEQVREKRAMMAQRAQREAREAVAFDQY